ncbi:hypothetical protein ACTFIV_001469 [Dictyostelium citrinum]
MESIVLHLKNIKNNKNNNNKNNNNNNKNNNNKNNNNNNKKDSGSLSRGLLEFHLNLIHIYETFTSKCVVVCSIDIVLENRVAIIEAQFTCDISIVHPITSLSPSLSLLPPPPITIQSHHKSAKVIEPINQ